MPEPARAPCAARRPSSINSAKRRERSATMMSPFSSGFLPTSVFRVRRTLGRRPPRRVLSVPGHLCRKSITRPSDRPPFPACPPMIRQRLSPIVGENRQSPQADSPGPPPGKQERAALIDGVDFGPVVVEAVVSRRAGLKVAGDVVDMRIAVQGELVGDDRAVDIGRAVEDD